MSTKLQAFGEVLDSIFVHYPRNSKGGKPLTYAHSSFVLFFIVVFYKRIFAFKAMEKYAQSHFSDFGFPKAPDRKTIRLRFWALPELLHFAIPKLAIKSLEWGYSTFQFRFAFIDKSVFRSKGGIWHKKHIQAGIVPHPSIDTDASWAKSAYHKWRFGYGLHIVCNENRFPISACVTTACVKDHTLIEGLLNHLHSYIGVLVGDNGYFALRTLKAIYKKWEILVHTPQIFINFKNTAANWFKTTYNDLVKTVQARFLYKKRKSSIEPVFSSIKELFDLTGNNQLPYKSLKYVQPFLLTSVITLQILMIDNFINNRDLSNTETFFTHFR
jgi:hypothetical protein